MRGCPAMREPREMNRRKIWKTEDSGSSVVLEARIPEILLKHQDNIYVTIYLTMGSVGNKHLQNFH